MVPGELDIAGGFAGPMGVWRYLDGSWRGGVLLVILCLAVYLPGFFTLPVVDRDEARFAQASRQMMESGDYVVPRVQGRPRLNKPPLIYWMQAASACVLSAGGPDAIWMYRVPSLLGAVAAVLATWRLGCSMFEARTGWLGAAIFAVGPIVFWEAHQARADMVLVACTTVAVWMLWGLWKEGEAAATGQAPKSGSGTEYIRPPAAGVPAVPFLSLIVLWGAVAAGVLTKGPITPMVVGLGIVMLSAATRRWRWVWRLRPMLGVLLVAAAIGPWVWLVSRQVGWETYESTIRDEVLGRSLEPKEGHGGFPGYHAIAMPVLLFPGSVLIGVGLWGCAREALAFIRGPNKASSSAPLFLVSLLVPTWLVLELVGTKLPHYTMPLYPLLALIAARAACVDKAGLGLLLKQRIVFAALVAYFILIPAALLSAGAIYGLSLRELGGALGASAAALLLTGAFAWAGGAALRRRDMPSVLLAGIIGFAAATSQVTGALPRFGSLWVSREVVRKLDAIDPSHERPIASVASSGPYAGYQEDSLIFLTRGRIERISDAELGAWIASHPRGLLVLPADPKFDYKDFVILGAVEGLNYSKGRRVYLALAEARH